MRNYYRACLSISLVMFIMFICFGCGNGASSEEKIIYEACSEYREELLRPETFRIYSAEHWYYTDDTMDRMKEKKKEQEESLKELYPGGEVPSIFVDAYYVSFGVEDRGGDMQQGDLLIEKDTGKWVRYDNIVTSTQEGIDKKYGTCLLFSDMKTINAYKAENKDGIKYYAEAEEISKETIKKINKSLSE